MSKFSVKKPFTVFVAVVFALILGLVSFTRMTTDLLPSFSLPYVMVITTYPGASPERVEQTVIEPLESALGTVNGVVNVSSTSSENYGMVMLEFEEGTNMDSSMVKLSSALDLVPLPEEAGSPMVLELSMDMLPVLYASVDYDGKDIYELSKFVEETVMPELERQNGVAGADAIGLISKSVEIRLNEEKIDALNDKLLGYVNDELADAKKEIDDATSKLSGAKSQLQGAQSELAEQQASTTKELAQTSLALDQAVATQSAYNANLSGLQASKTALEMEKQAYADADIENNYNLINSVIAALPTAGTITPLDIKDAIANPARFESFKAIVSATPQGAMVASLTVDDLVQMDNAMDRIPQIETELGNLNTEIAAAQMAADAVNQQVQAAVDNYATLEEGKMTASIGFGSGIAQISSGLSTIESTEAQLKDAQKAYENGRDTALKNANLDALLNIDTLKGLIYAQNFAMPAGYIYEGDDQYLLRVGDEFQSVEEMKDTLLCDIDGLGEVRLCDVADVTWIDNFGQAYAKVNGKDGVLLSVSKLSTAGTSTVSDTVNAKLEALEDEYEGLHFTNLMDQGEYIDLIVNNVLQNLLIGAVLAIIVLALFLKSIKPTLVVAFSIPLSVLVAIVLMYFSGVTLKLISLSGLALGIGMLVDNSIVVIENIYRLRGEGMSAARASVYGAKQVAGAIAASTLTTICVFLPIIFVNGLVKQLFVDMALTITYSLLASLVIALTVVPAMGATLLKKTEAKPQKAFDKFLGYYEKVLRFCLKRKLVPIVIAVALLAGCALKAVNTGMVLFPSMGGEQMSISLTAQDEMTDQEVFAMADQAMDQILDIEGVEYVGMMSGSDQDTGFSLGGNNGTHGLNAFVLLDEATAKDNSGVAEQMEAICESLDLKDYSVSTSNMDFSSYMETGLSLSIYGDDQNQLLDISEDLMDIVGEVEGFENITNGQEQGDATVELTIDKDEAMKYGLTVAQVLQELSGNLKTEATATKITVDGEQYDVVLVNELDAVSVSELMDYTFEVDAKDEDGNAIKEEHKLSEFAKQTEGVSLESIRRDNQEMYITVSADTADGYNTTLLTRELQTKLDGYQMPDGTRLDIGGETEEIMKSLRNVILMIILGVIFIYLIMVAQFQSLLSPFIVLFTIPLAFTGGFLGLYACRQDISLTAMMGFLMLTGVIVNNGIVFVDYTNQMRLAGMSKHEALVLTGRHRMRPILMTMLTTVLAMCTMVFSQDAASAMTRGMAVVVIGGLLYATVMTLIIVPVLYDLFFRKEMKVIDIGDVPDENELSEVRGVIEALEKNHEQESVETAEE